MGQGSNAVLVTLGNTNIRDLIFSEKKNLRKNDKMAYINENLVYRSPVYR